MPLVKPSASVTGYGWCDSPLAELAHCMDCLPGPHLSTVFTTAYDVREQDGINLSWLVRYVIDSEPWCMGVLRHGTCSQGGAIAGVLIIKEFQRKIAANVRMICVCVMV